MPNYSSNEYSGAPAWMTNVPIPEVQAALQKAEQQKQATANSLADYLEKQKAAEAAEAAPKPTAPKDNIMDEGTVFLVWKGKTDEPVTMEQGFPIRSGFHIADFADYETRDELNATVLRYQDIINAYEQLPSKTGTYVIVVGRMVAKVEKVIKQVEAVNIQF